jgi:peptide/nickel transport system substrate-binding protein
VDFRRAVAWAIDAKALNETLFSGKYTIADSWMHPEYWAHKPAKDYPQFDVAKAKAFLERSGVPEEKRRIKITSPDNVKTQFEFWQAALDKYLGIKSEFITDAQSKGKLNKNLGESPEIHMKVTGLSAKPDPHLIVATQLTKTGSFNYSGESTGAIEPLVAKAVSTYDMNERKKLYGEIQDIHADQLYSALPKVGKPFLFHATKNLKGARFTHDFRGSVIDLWLDTK